MSTNVGICNEHVINFAIVPHILKMYLILVLRETIFMRL